MDFFKAQLCYNFAMITTELTDYINKSRQSGMSDDAIRQALITAGWNSNDVNTALLPATPSTPSQPQYQYQTPISTQPIPQHTNSRKLLVTIVVTLVVLGTGVTAGLYFFNKKASQDLNPKPQIESNSTLPQSSESTVTPEQSANNEPPVQAPTPPANVTPKKEVNIDTTSSWKTYRNEQRKISFKYPSDAKITEIGGGITLTVSIDRQAMYTLYFLHQGRADDYSTYKVFTENKITIDGQQATERVFDSSGSGEITAGIEIKRYAGSDGFERVDGFFANFQNISDANKALPEIEAVTKTLKYF